MSDLHARFIDSAGTRAVGALLGLAGANRPYGGAGRSTVQRSLIADAGLRALLEQKITEADQLKGFLYSLDLPILHLSTDLRLRRFSQAAAWLFGLQPADLGGFLERRWPTAPMRAIADVYKSGTPFRSIAQDLQGKDWHLHILPHVAQNGAVSSFMVILLALPEPCPIDQPPSPETTDLTPRQRQVMDLVLAGQPSKNIAADLKISQRTVENHRAAIMQRTGATSLPALARLAIGADVGGDRKAIAAGGLLLASLR